MIATDFDQTKAEALGTRLFESMIGAMDLVSIYIGDHLGLYRALTDGPATAEELARRADIHPRYAREWLEQQAVTGILEVDDASLSENERRYALSPTYAAALTDPNSPFSVSPLAGAAVVCAQALPKVLAAYRTGGGVGWSDFGRDLVEVQGDLNRPWLVGQLGTEYLPSVPDLHARLLADPPARVLDVACGVGWSSIAIARAYPKVTVDGLDFDEPSLEIAYQNAAQAGVADRVRFQVRDATDPGLAGGYDLAVIVEAVHDMSRPVEALAAVRRLLAPGGTLIVADERVNESFTAPGDEIERLMYGFSLVVCLPGAMAEQPSAATGTVIRPSTMKRYATEAEFRRVEVLDIENPFLRFYRLFP